MSRNRHIHSGWQCDSCGALIRTLEDGRVEWLCEGGDEEPVKITGLRLVHARASSPRTFAPYGCEYDPGQEFRRNRSLVEGLPLSAFSGPDGLVLMLSMLAQGEYPADQLIELVKRLLVPGYEEARDLFARAIREEVVFPAIAPGYYLQSEIRDVLQWVAQVEEPDEKGAMREIR